MDEERKKRIITHSGRFHADDALAVAALVIMLDRRGEAYEIIRSRDPEVIATGDYVADVGGVRDDEHNRFDHHQSGSAGAHDNGIPYSSLGLVWRKFGEEIAGSKRAAEVIERRLVWPIDAADNAMDTYHPVNDYLRPYIFHDVKEVFIPTWQETHRTLDDGFMEFLPFARLILEREIVWARSIEEGEKVIRELYEGTEDKRIVVMDDNYPWEEALSSYPEPLYVVKPNSANNGNWSVKAVRGDVRGSFEDRKSLPAEWAGKTGDDLASATGVKDAVFCHNERYIAVAGSKEGALALAKQAVDA